MDVKELKKMKERVFAALGTLENANVMLAEYGEDEEELREAVEIADVARAAANLIVNSLEESVERVAQLEGKLDEIRKKAKDTILNGCGTDRFLQFVEDLVE